MCQAGERSPQGSSPATCDAGRSDSNDPGKPCCTDAADDGVAPSTPDGHAPDVEEQARLAEVRQQLAAACAAARAADPGYLSRPLADLNSEAARLQRSGDALGALAAYDKLFERARALNLTHPELYVCHCNAAGACLELRLFEDAARHADRCRQLAEASLRRNTKGSGTYIKSFQRKGGALMGLRRHREAAAVYGEALKMDPFNIDLKDGLQRAERAVLADLVEGRGREARAITCPDPAQRITYHPASAPLHRVRTGDMLPLRLLTPFQAENDHHIKDTYNYVTVQTDIKLPRRHFTFLEDGYFNSRFQQAIEAAVGAITADDRDCRVLNVGAGAGLHAMMALRAGAAHVAATERWLYLALACSDSLKANKFEEERYKVLYKRPCDLTLINDVPVCCNLIIANVFDEGLLTSGIIPAVSHALSALATTDASVLPAAATVWAQAVELRTKDVAGFDMSATNLYRWHPAYAAGGVPLGRQGIAPLSEPQEVWYFNLSAPPEKGDSRTLDVSFTRDGRWNAVMFWYTLHLGNGIELSTGPDALDQPGARWLQPAVQYLAGELPVEAHSVVPLLASHNTVRLRFDLEAADYLHLHKPDASFPERHFAMLADAARCEAYCRAIGRAVERVRAKEGEAHVLDLGTGTGVLALAAARAGADSVVACDIHPSLCDVARKAAAAAGLSKRVSVVARDAGLLQRGREVRPLGVNLLVADMFDAGLVGDGFPYLLELLRRKVLAPGAAVVPAGATVYAVGVQALTGSVAGFDLRHFNKYRWDSGYEAVRLAEVPHLVLTRPARVAELFFDGDRRPRGRDSVLRLEAVRAGTLNAVAFWFDLHLDDQETLSNGELAVFQHAADTGSGAGPALLLAQPVAFLTSVRAAPPAPAAPPGVDTGALLLLEAGAVAAAEPATAAAGIAPGSRAVAPPADGPGHNARATTEEFVAAPAFEGARPGYYFTLGDAGLGYYKLEAPDGNTSEGSTAASAAVAAPVGRRGARGFAAAPAFAGLRHGCYFGLGEAGLGYYSLADDLAGSASNERAAAESTIAAAPAPAAAEPATAEPVVHSSEPAAAAPAGASEEGAAATSGSAPPGEHYWGQALQYLDAALEVLPGRRVTLLAKRDGGAFRFSPRAGAGAPVERAPWRQEWGGGASVENPHFQRVHYCELLVRDFLMRVRSKRFPPIEEDMKMVLAHCGSLFLEPGALQEVYHELVLLEQLHGTPEFSPGASLPAVTRRPLRLC